MKRDNRLSARDQWIRAAQLFGCEGAAVCMRPTIGYSWTTSCGTSTAITITSVSSATWRHLRVRPAPLFDTGASLWCGELAIDNRDYKAKPFYATYKTPTARRQLRLISDWTRYDLGKLDGWEEQVGHRLSVTGLVPETRITAIATMLSARIRERPLTGGVRRR